MTTPERPKLRPVEVRPVTHEGEQVFVVSDPAKVSNVRLPLTLPGFVISTLFDGERTARDVQAELAKRGAIVPVEVIHDAVRVLDDALLLEGPRFEEALATWKATPVREPACAGGNYPDDPDALRGFLEAQMTRQGGPGGPPEVPNGSAPVRVVVSPHIDFHRGGHAYAWAWRAVAEACEAEVFVVFGTAHAGTGSARFALTRKDYATPIGAIPTDTDVVDRLVACYEGEDDLFEGEVSHKGEHSIEFQVVQLAHVFSGKRPVRVVPILCGSLRDLIASGESPSSCARLRAFHDALAHALSPIAPEKLAIVAGVDLAHRGSDFDEEPLDAASLERVLEGDRGTLRALCTEQDPEALHRDVAQDGDARNVCGHAPLVATLEAARRQKERWGPLVGEVLCHDRWYDGASAVSFASAVLRAARG